MASSKEKPIEEADGQGRAELGRQLERRREELGYGDSRPRFWEERGVNKRLSADIENAYRANFDAKTLRRIARGYGVTYDSLVAVAYRKAEKLTPEAIAPGPQPGSPSPLSFLGPAQLADNARGNATRPHAQEICEGLARAGYLREVAPGWFERTGAPEPTGAELFGEGTPDAKTWDNPDLRGRLTVPQMVWLIAEMRRIDAERDAGSNASGRAGA